MHPANESNAEFAYRDSSYHYHALSLLIARQAYFDNPHADTFDEYELALAAVRAEEDRIIAASRVVPASAVPVRFAPRGVQ